MAERALRIVFMGTPTFAVPSLNAVLNLNKDDGLRDTEVVGVVTQPDRPAGRGKRLTASPVKEGDKQTQANERYGGSGRVGDAWCPWPGEYGR